MPIKYITATVAVTNTAQQVTSSLIETPFATIQAEVGNAAIVKFGDSNATASSYAFEVTPGGRFDLFARDLFPGRQILLSDLYIIGTADDVIHLSYA
jgi:hypothetical protein